LGLGAAAVLLGIDLLANEIALQSERAQNGAIDVLAVSRDLLGRNGEERLSVLDFIAVGHVQLFDHTALWYEYFCRPRRWPQIAYNGLLACVLRAAGEGDDRDDRAKQQPSQ